MDNTTRDNRSLYAAIRAAATRAAQPRLDGRQQTPRPVTQPNMPPPTYQTNPSESTTETDAPRVSAEEEILLKMYRDKQRLIYHQSFPASQYKSQVKEELNRIKIGEEKETRDIPVNVEFATIAKDEIKKRWMEQGIWNDKWTHGTIWKWKHEEPPEPDVELQTNLALAARHGQSQGPEPDRALAQKESRHLAHKRAARDRDREASRPFIQFIYQIARQREWIEEQATADGAAAINSADIYSRAYQETKDLWKKRGVWNRAWTLMPGIAWGHERPLDEALNDGIVEHLASTRAKKHEREQGLGQKATQSTRQAPVTPLPVALPKKPTPTLSNAEEEQRMKDKVMGEAIQSGIDPTRAAQLVDDLQRIRAHRRKPNSTLWPSEEAPGNVFGQAHADNNVQGERQEPPRHPPHSPPNYVPPAAVPGSSQPQHPPATNPHIAESSQPPPTIIELSQSTHPPTNNSPLDKPSQSPSPIAEPSQPKAAVISNPTPTDQNQPPPFTAEPLQPEPSTMPDPSPAELSQTPQLETAAASNPPQVPGDEQNATVPEPSPQTSPPRVKRRPGRPAGSNKRSQPDPPPREGPTEIRRSRRIQEAAEAKAASTSRASADSCARPLPAKRGRPRASNQAPSTPAKVTRGAKRQRVR